MQSRIQQLRNAIDYHNDLYYKQTNPEISDAQFDRMFQKLVELETEYPEHFNPNSPTSRVGSDLNNSFSTISHLSPMLSVNSVQTADQIEEFITGFDTIAQLKYDGVGVNLIYKFGKLFNAVTRGDGYKGIDVTANIRTFAKIPYTIKWLNDICFDTPFRFDTLAILKTIRHGCPASAASITPSLKDIPADGIIFKHNDLMVCKAEGHTSRNVNWAISWKFDKEIFQGTIAGIGGHVAANGRVDHILFINPITINNEVISKIPISEFFPNMDVTIGQKIDIRRVGTRVAKIVSFTDGETPSELLTHCPQCSASLVRRGSQSFCSAKCQGTPTPPESENLTQSITISIASFSVDSAMFQYIVNENNCRIFRLKPKSNSYRLYYNNTKQLADIGHQVGAYVKQF